MGVLKNLSIAIAVSLLLTIYHGCSVDAHRQVAEPERAIAKAFSNEQCPHFFEGGRCGGLREILGASLPETIEGGVQHTSDGLTLRFKGYYDTQCYILQAGQTPQVIDAPKGALLDEQNRVI